MNVSDNDLAYESHLNLYRASLNGDPANDDYFRAEADLPPN
jgi:hypothetical protein